MSHHSHFDSVPSPIERARTWSTVRALAFAPALALLALTGCKITEPHWCLQMEYGDCSGGQGEPIETMRVVGFPPDRVDSMQQGFLRVGETATLKLVLFSQSSIDTSHTATWALDGSVTAARIARDATGAGQLEGVAPGTVEGIVVNGQALPIWSCGVNTCAKLSHIVVSP